MKLTIEDPCHENWDAMKPNEQGSFCMSCQKTVIDFSSKSLNDIKSFFSELPLTQKVCGRFESRQLEELSFDDFFRRFKKWNLFHRIAVVCFFVFGLSLFSCTPGSSQKLGEVDHQRQDTGFVQKTVVDTPKVNEHMTLGEPSVVKHDSIRERPVKKPHIIQGGVRPMLKGDVSVEQPVEIMQGKVAVSPHPVKCAPKDTAAPMIKVGEIQMEK